MFEYVLLTYTWANPIENMPVIKCSLSKLFRFETFDTNAQSPFGLGKRIRVSATSILNVNVSAANLESFVGSVHSWRRQLEFEDKASKLNAVKF